MAAGIVPLGGYILALATLGFAVMFWRRANSLHALLMEAANRYEDIRQRAAKMEESYNRLRQKQSDSARLEKSLEDARQRNLALTREMEVRDAEYYAELRKWENKVDHFSEQVDSLMKQIQEADQVRKDAEISAKSLERDYDQKVKAVVEPYEKNLNEWKKKFLEAEAKAKAASDEFEQFKKQLLGLDPVQVKQIVRKSHQYERLYNSMRGLKEMAEERNVNWETALRRLSEHILTDSVKQRSQSLTIPKEIGPLVGEAMEKIGAKLVLDEDAIAKGHIPEPTPEEVSGSQDI